MEFADSGPRVTVTYEDLSDVWPVISKALEERLPLSQVTFTNKLGATVAVDKLPVRLVSFLDPAIQRLQQYSHSAMSWFRQPAATLVLISCNDSEDYKKNFRLQLRAMIDSESRHPLAAEPVFVYVAPPPSAELDPKGPGRVVDAMKRELGSRRRERIVRIDSPESPSAAPQGMEELISCLKLAISASVEARIAAYGEVIRQHMAGLAGAASSSFIDLFLVKDSLAAMMEASGLIEDAVREYLELEVACQQVEMELKRTSSGGDASTALLLCGVPKPGSDEAEGMWSGWRACRLAVQHSVVATVGGEPISALILREALFASQSRVLLKLKRHAEVLERGLAFLQHTYDALEQQESAKFGPVALKEAWVFAGCVTLAAAVATRHGQQFVDQSNGALGSSFEEKGSATPSDSRPYLTGVLEEGAVIENDDDNDRVSVDWRLGILPPFQTAAATQEESLRAASKAVYCMLGQLYCLARHQLEALGKSRGLVPPTFHPDLVAAASVSSTATSSAGAGGATRAMSGASSAVLGETSSPRKHHLQGARSVSPTRTSVDLGSIRNSPFLTTAAGGSIVEEGEEATSVSVSVHHQEENQVLFEENMHTIDLNAAAAVAVAGGAGPLASGAAGPLAAGVYQLQTGGSGNAEEETELSAARISADAAERGVELAPVAGAAAGSSAHHRRSLTATSGASAAASGAIKSIETDSATVTPRTNSAASAASATAVAPPTVEGEQVATIRQVERVLDAVFAEEGSTLQRVASVLNLPSQPALPSDTNKEWSPVHWRLRRALSSQASFADLWQALTAAAAASFTEGGHQRQAVLCHAEVADCLAAKGELHEAAALYETQCRVALAEGWSTVAISTLIKLAACQASLQDSRLVHTAAALLSLSINQRDISAAVLSKKESAAVATLLSRAAGYAESALPLPPPLLPARQIAAAAASPFTLSSETGAVDLSCVLAVHPIKGTFSRFYRRTDASGQPVLWSTGNAAASELEVSHVKCAVGDVAAVTVQIINRIESSISVENVRLSLVGMQEIAALASPRASSPHNNPFRSSMPGMPFTTRNSLGGTSASTPHQAPTPSTASANVGQGARPSTMAQSPFYRMDSFADEGPRFTTEWQDTEDLQCSLVKISSQGSSDSLDRNGLLSPLSGPIELLPGVNVLTFMAAPLKRGLYRPLHVTASLQNVDVVLNVAEAVDTLSGGMAVDSPWSSLQTSAAAASQLLNLDSSGVDTRECPVVLEVEPTLPRMAIAIAAAGQGALLAGQRQWLGLKVSPGRDTLDSATLGVTWPLPPAVADIARKVSGLFGLQASPAAAAALAGTTAVPGELSLAAAAAVADTGGVPSLLPQHAAALVAPHSARNGTTSVVHAVGLGSTPAPWADDGHQEIPLSGGKSTDSARETSGDVMAWWWVDAGSFISPPEQVKVGAPAGSGSGNAAQQHYHQQQQLFTSLMNLNASSSLAAPTQANAGAAAQEDPVAAATAAPPQQELLELPLSLQYVSGCRRTFSKVLQIHVRQPFAVRTTARELSSGVIIAHFTVVSLVSHPVTLTSASLSLQPGLLLKRDLVTELGLLPSTLNPHASFSLSFALTVDRTMAAGDRAAAQLRLQQAAKVQPTALQLSYSVSVQDICDLEVQLPSHSSTATAGHRTTVHGEHSTQQQASIDPSAAGVSQQHHKLQRLDHHHAAADSTIKLPSVDALQQLQAATATARPASAGSGDESLPATQSCSFIHCCAFELSALESDIPGAVVLVQLLGPFAASAGQPVSLCWRLERAGAADSAAEKPENSGPLRIQFEMAAEGDSWRPLGRRSGAVTLEPYDGALATIEASWVPLIAGTLPVPTLRLVDCAYQECFDVGSDGNLILVSPQPQ